MASGDSWRAVRNGDRVTMHVPEEVRSIDVLNGVTTLSNEESTMAKIAILHRHDLPKETARERVVELFEAYRVRFKASSEWSGDTLHLSGPAFRARATLASDNVDIEVKLGLAASLFRGPIESGLREELDKKFNV